ncbi:MAG: ATP-binding protein [Phycisphaeraceae bacterium]
MNDRVVELCRRLEPILPQKVNQIWSVYQADPDPSFRGQIEQMLEVLAQKHLGLGFQPDRSPFVPPPTAWAQCGVLPVGEVVYAGKGHGDFNLELDRLTEHVLVCGRSGSGKSTLTLHLARGLMQRGVIVTAFDWKRSYRELLRDTPPGNLRVRTPGRDLAPFFWNPLIPPPGTDPVLYAKLIVDVISRALLGGDGVISLLHRGILALYEREGVGTEHQQRWPTIHDLLEWLDSTKLTGRAAMWKSSADRILRAMTYGQFGRMIDTQSNADVLALLDTHHVLELDSLAGSADRRIFAEGVTLWLYRYLLHRGERKHLERVWIHEEAHHLFSQGESGSSESVLEHSLRMARAYGVGYMIVDQTASMLSKTVFSNTGTVFALNQKLRSDVQAIAGAMNLDDAQRQAVSTLSVGTAIARVPDGHPEPFLVRVPAPKNGLRHVTDEEIRQSAALVPSVVQAPKPLTVEDEIVALYCQLSGQKSKSKGSATRPLEDLSSRTDSGDSMPIQSHQSTSQAVTPIPSSEKYLSINSQVLIKHENEDGIDPTHPTVPSSVTTVFPDQSSMRSSTQNGMTIHSGQTIPPSTPESRSIDADSKSTPDQSVPRQPALSPSVQSQAAIRLLTDLVEHPLSTTVERYNRLHLSRRKGHALRTALVEADLMQPVRIPTRSGNVVLLDLTPRGRQYCIGLGLSPPPVGSSGIAHRFWALRVGEFYKREGYAVLHEHQVQGNGRVDLLAKRDSLTLPIEIETGRSDIASNIRNAIQHFEQLLLVATGPEAIERCARAIGKLPASQKNRITLKTWLDY